MRGRAFAALAAVASVVALSCSDNTGPKADSCLTGTAPIDVVAAISPAAVVFDWHPRCPMALLLVEQDGSDQWGIADPSFSANAVVPPITYGQLPSGLEQDPPPEPLIPGQTYELILWRIIPAGTTCSHQVNDACLIAVQPFVR
jgi:hypothetical protein